MANTYSMHYNREAGDFAMYDPTAASMMGGRWARLAPVCRIRGRKDVTADVSRVTCSKCLAAATKSVEARA